VTDDVEGARLAIRRAFGGTRQFGTYRSVRAHERVRGAEDVALIGDESQVRASIERLERAGATEFVATELCGTDEEAERTRSLLRELL